MAHIELLDGLPGILGPMTFRPETAKPLNDLAEALLCSDHSLSRGERELIAAYVSSLNQCSFCEASHSAFAARQLDGGDGLVDAVKHDPVSAPINDKLRALLGIAAKVQIGGRAVTAADIGAAREAGASDLEIHDTVLIAAAFCMYNRYVDGLDTWTPTDPAAYDAMAERIVQDGYVTT